MHERHVDFSFHHVREAAVAKIIACNFINGKINPANILSKHWYHYSAWPTLKLLLLWKGDTMQCMYNNALEFEEQNWN